MIKEKVQNQNAVEPEVEPHLLAWQTGKRQLPKAKDLPPIFRELVMNAPKTLQTLVFISSTSQEAESIYHPSFLTRKAYGQLVMLGFGISTFTPASYQRRSLQRPSEI